MAVITLRQSGSKIAWFPAGSVRPYTPSREPRKVIGVPLVTQGAHRRMEDIHSHDRAPARGTPTNLIVSVIGQPTEVET